ncbi:hypothetical protein [Glutamicibacter protophormiae]
MSPPAVEAQPLLKFCALNVPAVPKGCFRLMTEVLHVDDRAAHGNTRSGAAGQHGEQAMLGGSGGAGSFLGIVKKDQAGIFVKDYPLNQIPA